jgi:hypothetical protein
VRSIMAYALDCGRARSLAPWARAQASSILSLLARSQVRLIVVLVQSSELTGTTSSYCLIPPFKSHFHAKDLQHTKTLKLIQRLENNKDKSLTNIS